MIQSIFLFAVTIITSTTSNIPPPPLVIVQPTAFVNNSINMTSDESENPAKRQKTVTSDESENPAKRQRTEENGSDIVPVKPSFNAAGDVDNSADFQTDALSIPLLPRDVKVLLLDIEGCTTAISFVKDVLFPFVLSQLDKFMEDTTPEKLTEILTSLKEDIEKLPKDHPARIDTETNEKASEKPPTDKEQISIRVNAMVKADVKATGLKSLQGSIWKSGYASGTLKGHIYDDFQPLLTWCKSQSVSVNIYSSGSIGAQKLLFGKSDVGDLTSHFDHHFDTTSGGKKEAASYKKIAGDLGVDVKEICFVSDAEAELVAAREAGIGFPVMSVRRGNAPLTDVGRGFPIIFSLLQLCGSGS